MEWSSYAGVVSAGSRRTSRDARRRITEDERERERKTRWGGYEGRNGTCRWKVTAAAEVVAVSRQRWRWWPEVAVCAVRGKKGAAASRRAPGPGARKHGDRVSCFLIYGRQQWTPKKQKTKDGLFISVHCFPRRNAVVRRRACERVRSWGPVRGDGREQGWARREGWREVSTTSYLERWLQRTARHKG